MQKTLLTMVVCTLAFATFPPTASAAPEPVLTISDGDITAGTDHEQQCDGQTALLVADVPGCDFEDDTRTGFYMIIGFKTINGGSVGPIPLTGDVTAHLTSAGGNEIVFTCSWSSGTWTGCRLDTFEGWPLLGEGFSFDCYSAEGSLGNWGECYVGH